MTDRGASGGYRASVTGILAVAMGVSVLPSFCLGVLAGPILRDLQMSRADLGLASGAISGVCAISSIWLGHLADRRGGRATLLLAFGLGGAGFLAMAVAPTFAILLVAVVLGGLCQGVASPATNRVVLDALGAGRRGLLTGLKQSGEMGAIVLAGAMLPVAAVTLGWRGTVALVAAIPAIAMLATLVLLPPRADKSAGQVAQVIRAPLSHDVWWLATYTFFLGLSGGAVSTYLPLYAEQAAGVTIVTAGHVLAFTGLVAIPGRILWGRRAERASSYPSQFMILSALAAVGATLLWAGSAVGVGFLWVGAVAWGLSQLSFGAVMTLGVMTFAASDSAGRATGIVIVGFSVGLMIGPVIFGRLIDLTNGYDAGFGAVVGVLLTATVLSFAWRRRQALAALPLAGSG
ncbi:MAG: MFS transporter [Chloroflexota bacterium]